MIFDVCKGEYERGTRTTRAFTGSPRAPQVLNIQKPLSYVFSKREEHEGFALMCRRPKWAGETDESSGSLTAYKIFITKIPKNTFFFLELFRSHRGKDRGF